MSKKKKPKVQNFVHKHMEEFNRAQTHEDQKKAQKKGKVKHKGRDWDTSFLFG
ncbi:hypothetical protein XaC1_91 [Xanthomonas phage XaC1]|nr:hypothetical protein XaC1_91 [Xanthomonas phage XaC1]